MNVEFAEQGNTSRRSVFHEYLASPECRIASFISLYLCLVKFDITTNPMAGIRLEFVSTSQTQWNYYNQFLCSLLFLCYIVLIILKSFCLASARLRDSWFIFLSEVHTSKVQLFTSEVVLRSLILFLVRCWKVLGVLCKYFRFHGFWTFCRVNVQSRLRKSLWNLWIDANFLSPMWNIHTQLNSLVNATHLFAVIQTETLKKITKSLLQKTGNVYTYIICCAQAEPWEKNLLQQKL